MCVGWEEDETPGHEKEKAAVKVHVRMAFLIC